MADVPDFAELARRFRAAASGLRDFSDSEGAIIGNNAIDSIKDRIIQRGEAADGKPLRRPEAVGGIVGFGQGETDDYSEEYKKRKIKAGRYRGHIDLMFTGRMWASTGVVEKKVGPKGEFALVIAAKNEENQNKLDWNSERYGDVLELSIPEKAELQQDFNDDLDIYLSGHLEGTT